MVGQHIVMAVLWAVSVAAPAGAGANVKTADDFAYSTEKARELWRPMFGSKGVSVVRLNSRRGLKMPCAFAGRRVERASWDRAITMDLTMAKGLQFWFHCADPSPVSHFTVYLHSPKGWYRSPFTPPAGPGWGLVRIPKSAMGIEGTPGGWGRVDTVRISAWRGKNADTVFHIADLALYGTGGQVVIVRGDSAVKTHPGEAESIRRYAAVMAGMLDRAGLDNMVMSDSDLTAERLKGIKLIILPHNPAMGDKTADVLGAYLKSGGKMLSCYTLPRRLATLAGIRLGRHVRQKHKGRFASIRPSAGLLPGAPPAAAQASWNIRQAFPVPGRSRVAATWHDKDGRSTGQAAIVLSETCIHVTHVVLPDDRANKQQLVLAMVGQAVPDLWRQIASGRIARAGVFGPYRSFAAAGAGISTLAAGRSPAVALLREAHAAHQKAGTLTASGKHIAAADEAAKAHDTLVEAYLLAQKPQAGEHRAFWCHSAFGVDGMTWDQAVKTLADNGFTAVLPNMLWGQTAFHPSDVLPVSPQVADKGDQIALCLAACKKYGVQCHVWKVNYNMGSRARKKTVADLTAAGRTQVGFNGRPRSTWLCPSHPANQALEIDSMVEIARKYDVAGLHFDYIRYPGRDHCFCPGCRKRFEKAAGVKVARWPADLRTDAALEKKWLDFRRRQITTVVAAVAERARKVRPGIKISAAVFRNWPVDRDRIGQDWKLWCDKGYLDFVCPMDYVADSGQFERMVAAQLPWAGKVPCYPGIGLSTWSDATDVCSLIEKITITRRLKTGGFTIFNYGTSEARDILPALGKGITRKP